jgi:hypothetical protein
MKKVVKGFARKIPPQDSTGKKTGRGFFGKQPAMLATKVKPNLTRKVTKGKSLSAKKTKTRKRDRQGNMQNTGIAETWKPFMK